MPAKKSNPTKRPATKGKTTARKNATARAEGRERTGARRKVAPSDQAAGGGRFPGEVPLTGEDRPADRPGGKQDRGSKRKPS